MLPPLINQPIVQGTLPTRPHHQFLQAMYDALIAAQADIDALQAEAGHYETLGPFYVNDLPGTATTTARLGRYDGTGLIIGGDNPTLARNGRIVGGRLISDADRTAGTATLLARIGATNTAFDGGSVQLNGTNVSRAQSLVPWASGLTVISGDLAAPGVAVQTVGWTPTTANIIAYLIVKYEAF